MDTVIYGRLQAVFRKFHTNLDCPERSSGDIIGTPQTRRIIKKWKYKTKSNDRSTAKPNILPLKSENLQSLYYNMIELTGRNYKNLNLYSLEQMLERICSIIEGVDGTLLAWDDIWINELRLASKGWKFHSLVGEDSKTLVLKCSCGHCPAKIYLDLKPSDTCDNENIQNLVNKKYWEVIVMQTRSGECPWVSYQFDLKDYYLKESNLMEDIERVQCHNSVDLNAESDNCSSIMAEEQLSKMSDYFRCKNKKKLELLLRGYMPLDGSKEVVVCARCFRKAFISSLLDNVALNCHRSWCRYHDEGKLMLMINEQLEEAVSTDEFETRLNKLKNYVENI